MKTNREQLHRASLTILKTACAVMIGGLIMHIAAEGMDNVELALQGKMSSLASILVMITIYPVIRWTERS